MKPSAPIYPDLSNEYHPDLSNNSDKHNYRLTKISGIEDKLISERDARKTLYKQYKRGVNIIDGIDTVLITSGVVLGGVGLALPILLPLEIAAIVLGTTGVCMKLVKRKLHAKAQKHDKIRTIAVTKLNSISELISTALQDGHINDNEFKTVVNELNQYNKLKDMIRSKQPQSLSQEEKKELIEQGKTEALKIIQNNIKNV